MKTLAAGVLIFVGLLVSCSDATQVPSTSSTQAVGKRQTNCLVTGFEAEPVCGYSFVQIIGGAVPTGPVAIYGYLVRSSDGLYLFMSKESVAGGIYRESIYVSLAPSKFKGTDALPICKFVQVIGRYSSAEHHVDDAFSSTAGQIVASSIRSSQALSVEC